jgi:hypothetical protein
LAAAEDAPELTFHHVDHYLWRPGARVNVKLRGEMLKVKRRLRSEGDGCELWTERPEDCFPLDLGSDALERLRTLLGATPPPQLAFGAVSLEGLCAALPSFDPPIGVVRVEKRRRQRVLRLEDRLQRIELTELLEPQQLWSVGLEGEDLGEDPEEARAAASLHRLRGLIETLGLPGAMRVGGYLQVLEQWQG